MPLQRKMQLPTFQGIPHCSTEKQDMLYLTEH